MPGKQMRGSRYSGWGGGGQERGAEAKEAVTEGAKADEREGRRNRGQEAVAGGTEAEESRSMEKVRVKEAAGNAEARGAEAEG